MFKRNASQDHKHSIQLNDQHEVRCNYLTEAWKSPSIHLEIKKLALSEDEHERYQPLPPEAVTHLKQRMKAYIEASPLAKGKNGLGGEFTPESPTNQTRPYTRFTYNREALHLTDKLPFQIESKAFALYQELKEQMETQWIPEARAIIEHARNRTGTESHPGARMREDKPHPTLAGMHDGYVDAYQDRKNDPVARILKEEAPELGRDRIREIAGRIWQALIESPSSGHFR